MDGILRTCTTKSFPRWENLVFWLLPVDRSLGVKLDGMMSAGSDSVRCPGYLRALCIGRAEIMKSKESMEGNGIGY